MSRRATSAAGSKAMPARCRAAKPRLQTSLSTGGGLHMSTWPGLANAEWAKEPHMLKAEQVDFEIRLWPLLKGDLVLPSLGLRKPEIIIEKGDKDRLNWELGEA